MDEIPQDAHALDGAILFDDLMTPWMGSKTSPGPQFVGLTVSSARLRLPGWRGQRDRAWVRNGGHGGSLQVRGGIFSA